MTPDASLPPLTDEDLAAIATYYGEAGTTAYDEEVVRVVDEVERMRVVATDLAVALHQCETFLPLFLSEHGEEGRKLQRALAVHERVQTAMAAHCTTTGTRRQDLNDRTVTPKDAHD